MLCWLVSNGTNSSESYKLKRQIPAVANPPNWLLYELLLAQLPVGFSVWKEEPLTLVDSEPEPDISVTRGSKKDFKSAHPSTAESVIEVAVSNPALDRESAFMYAEAGVKEYWIVLAPEREVEVYRRAEGGCYQEKRIFTASETVTCVSLPGLQIAVSEFFA